MTYFPNDADIELAQLERQGARAAAARKRGQCYHGSRHIPAWSSFADTEFETCADCFKSATRGELDDDMHNILGG